jgi:hypothetical protein
MNILFAGAEEEYYSYFKDKSYNNDYAVFTPFNLVFVPDLNIDNFLLSSSILLVPAIHFLKTAFPVFPIPVITCGQSNLAEECFKSGCSDMLCDPWTFTELIARSKRCIKNQTQEGSLVIKNKNVHGPIGQKQINPAMNRLLNLLINNKGKMVPKTAIASVCGIDLLCSGRAIDMRIARLRRMLRSVGATEAAESIQCYKGSYTFLESE